MRRLTIISHTEHYKTPDDILVGWGPTINEINHLLKIFDHIYHVAMLHDQPAPPSSLPYQSKNVTFVPLPVLGGASRKDKLKIIFNSQKVIRIVNSALIQSDYFQLRTPTGIGVFLIPYLSVFTKKKGWYKYAGNWNQENPPMGYKMQRLMLKKQSRTVTINGKWEQQPNHCLTFENPCLTQADLILGQSIAEEKRIDGKISICYVGRLEKQKGVERIIKAIGSLSEQEKQRIKAVHLVGNGPDIESFKTLSNQTNILFVFHGFLNRKAVFKIYEKTQAFLMPTTASEGFPKVIAEAMNFGCLPLVSTVSSIGQYIKEMETGICIDKVNDTEVLEALRRIITLDQINYQRILNNQRKIVKLFTFEHYNSRIENEILD